MPGRIRALLLRSEVRPAGRLAECKHDKKHKIRKGDARLVVKDAGPAGGERGYCKACAAAMIEQAAEDLARLRAQLEEADG